MPSFISLGIVVSRLFAMLLRRYHRLHALQYRLRDDLVGVVTSISKQLLRGEALDQTIV